LTDAKASASALVNTEKKRWRTEDDGEMQIYLAQAIIRSNHGNLVEVISPHQFKAIDLAGAETIADEWATARKIVKVPDAILRVVRAGMILAERRIGVRAWTRSGGPAK
jgi:hypothetical protein